MSRYGIGLIVLACVVFAGARYPGFSRDVATDSAPELSDEQRSRIFDSVVRSDVPIAEVAAPEVADSLPAEVPTQDLPDDIIRENPLIRGHKFVKFDDRILVISSSRLVVAMLPRYKLLP